MSAEPIACGEWVVRMRQQGIQLVVPEIADYEVRRELIRARKIRGLRRLDVVKHSLLYAPITTAIMLRAAEYWARARQGGKPSAPDASLDADMILAAQAADFAVGETEVTVATFNIKHLA